MQKKMLMQIFNEQICSEIYYSSNFKLIDNQLNMLPALRTSYKCLIPSFEELLKNIGV